MAMAASLQSTATLRLTTEKRSVSPCAPLPAARAHYGVWNRETVGAGDGELLVCRQCLAASLQGSGLPEILRGPRSYSSPRPRRGGDRRGLCPAAPQSLGPSGPTGRPADIRMPDASPADARVSQRRVPVRRLGGGVQRPS